MPDEREETLFTADELQGFSTELFQTAGLDEEKAATVAALLLEADLMGHDTHGLALAPRYLEEILQGSMKATGEPEVVGDLGACITWDGQRLPGVWLVAKALELGLARVPKHGCVTLVMRRAHHIGCLAAYLPRATAADCMALIASSDPSQPSVAPYGGTEGLFTPNPIAAGIPTGGDPILIDTSTSITTNNMAARMQREGRRYPSACLIDAAGNATDDPEVLKRGGTILPAGGLDHGQKGYGWALLVEALTQGLSGFGRADAPRDWGASVFIQVMDPRAFGGLTEFTRQMGWLFKACTDNRPRHGVERVRVPGHAGLARKRMALKEGVRLYPGVAESLRTWADRLNVPFPAARQ